MARILCLHGWRANPTVVELQVGPLQVELPDVRFEALAGPIDVGGKACDDDVGRSFDPPFYDWWLGDSLESVGAAVRHVAVHCRVHGPFDAVLGFSQGAAVATLLVAAQESLQVRTALGLPATCPPFCRVVVCVCGMSPPKSFHRSAEGQAPAAPGPVELLPGGRRLQTTAVHVYGLEDPEGRCGLPLLDEWYGKHSAAAVSHAGGHRFPAAVEETQLFASSIVKALGAKHAPLVDSESGCRCTVQ